MSSRAHARRRLAAWDRYRRRYPFGSVVSWAENGWWLRARRHRPGRRRLCGAVYVDPHGGDRPPQDPCGKLRGHQNGPETDWKRGYHSNGMLKWLVEP